MLATDTCHECNVHVCMRNHDMGCMPDMTYDIWWWRVIRHGMLGHDKNKSWMSIDFQKSFLLVSRFLQKTLHNLLTCVHFFSVDFFVCQMARVNMPFTKHRCILPRELTSADKHLLCTIYGKTHDKDQRATCSPWARVNQHPLPVAGGVLMRCCFLIGHPHNSYTTWTAELMDVNLITCWAHGEPRFLGAS